MMFRSAIFVFSFALTGFAHHDPITELPPGTYLGEGKMISMQGDEYTYASQATINSDELNLAIVRGGELFSYNLYFNFNDHGFFTVEATEYDEDGNELTHYGNGYCASVQCHFSFDLDNRKIEETLTFATWEDKIYTIGSMRYVDEYGNDQALSWEERFLLLDEGYHRAR